MADPTAALRELVEEAERFSTEADYSVAVSTEEDFVAALEDAHSTLNAQAVDPMKFHPVARRVRLLPDERSPDG